MVITVDKAGDASLPAELLVRLGCKPGTALDVDLKDGMITVRPNAESGRLEMRDGILVFTGEVPSDLDIVALIKEDREARSRHTTGELPGVQE